MIFQKMKQQDSMKFFIAVITKLNQRHIFLVIGIVSIEGKRSREGFEG